MKLTESLIERFNSMEIFKTVDEIPSFPPVDDEDEYQTVIVSNLIRCGAIPKKDLEIGASYTGSCRNTSTAKWTGTKFEYDRYKYGMHYIDTINHFEDDRYYDVFIPLKKI